MTRKHMVIYILNLEWFPICILKALYVGTSGKIDTG